MENSPIIRFRVDRQTAERAHRMAAQKGLEQSDRTGATTVEQLKLYDPLYWSEAQSMLDAELALAVLQQVVADRTTSRDEGQSVKVTAVDKLARIRNERDDACALLAAFEPKDAATAAKILDRFAAGSATGSTSEPPP